MKDTISKEERKADNLMILEEMIDGQGLSGVLDLLADVCYLKQEHINENWSDNSIASTWGLAAGAIYECMDNADIKFLQEFMGDEE